MMKIIDKYLMMKYLKAFFFTALLFSLISIVINLAEKLDDFLSNDVTLKEIIFSYYIPFVVEMNGTLWPLFALISVIFFTSRVAKNAEILSFLNSGTSLFRILVPYLLGAGLIMCLHLWLNHSVIPNANKKKIPFENALKSRQNRSARHIHMMVSPTQKIYIQQFNVRDSTITNLRLEAYENNRLVAFTESRKAKWIDSLHTWRLQQYVSRDFTDSLNHKFQRNFKTTIDTFFQIAPTDIIQVQNEHQMMNTKELRAHIKKQNQRGVGGTRPYLTELYRRSADSLSILILSLIGFSVAARKVRGGIGLHLSLGIGIGALFILVGKFTQTFTNAESIGPFWGVSLPNIMFGLVALLLFSRSQR